MIVDNLLIEIMISFVKMHMKNGNGRPGNIVRVTL
jgi:hypothetical protein